MVLRQFGNSLKKAVKKITNRGPIDKKAISQLKNDLFKALLEADVSLRIASEVVNKVENRSLTEKLPKKINRKKAMTNIIYEELIAIMGVKSYGLNLTPDSFNIITLVGIQGSGKTTTVARIANYLKKEKWKIGIICADTWRPGALEQLSQLGKQLGIDVYGDAKQKKSIKIASDGIKIFKKSKKNLIIIDTSGRHSVDKALLKELNRMHKKINPNENILVIDGTSGNQVEQQAQAFSSNCRIDSIVITKLDGTSKGGGAITASAITNSPIKFVGVGEKLNDLEVYDPTKMVSRLLGIGDLKSLIKEVKEANIDISSERANELIKGNITYDDVITMMETMKSMGGFGKVMDMIPGSFQVDDKMINMTKENMGKFKIMISSMTSSEREAKVKLNHTRIKRISEGSGITEKEIKQLVNQKKVAEKAVKQFTKPRRKGKGNPLESAFDLPFMN